MLGNGLIYVLSLGNLSSISKHQTKMNLSTSNGFQRSILSDDYQEKLDYSPMLELYSK